MDFNTYLLIGVAILSMFFGYFFGLFEGRGQGYKKRQKEEEEELATDTPAEETEPEEDLLPTKPPEAPAFPTRPSLMRLSQNSDGRLQLDLDDEPVLVTTITPDQRKRLIALLTAVRPWVDGKQSPTTPPPPKPEQVQPMAAMPESASEPASPAPPLADVPAVDEPPVAPKSIVSQIDAILQLRIVGTPLQQKGIKLQESAEGGVLVWVGLEKFQSVDEVTDEAIKSAIRAAIVEWENRFTPGL